MGIELRSRPLGTQDEAENFELAYLIGVEFEVDSIALSPCLCRITLDFFALVVRSMTWFSAEKVNFCTLLFMFKVLLGLN